MIVRPLGDNDTAGWLRLRCALWPDQDPGELQEEMDSIRADGDRQPVFVAETPDGSLCGLLEASIRSSAPGCTSDRIGYLEGWYVDPEWRDRGLGRRLVEAAEAWAQAVGCQEMASDTTPGYPLSPGAHEALGYKEVARYFRKAL